MVGTAKPIEYAVVDGCWECTSHSLDRYARIRRGGRNLKVHRYVYEIMKGPIAEGNVIMHTCDNPRCINPDHLVQGTYADNTQDMLDKKRGLIGDMNHNSKLTDQQRADIRNSGVPNTRLAAQYGVSRRTIQDIKGERKRWQ